MTRINQHLVSRMIDHGYSDQEIAFRLRYNEDQVKLIRERAQTVREKLNLPDDKKNITR